MKSKSDKKTVKRSVTDASWTGQGAGGVSSGFSVQSLRAIDKTLSPQDAYALSIDLRSAIHARNEPLSQGKIRLFYRKTGDEIIGGDTYNSLQQPCPAMSQSSFIYELGSWRDLAGEMIVGSIFNDSQLPAGIYPLNPFQLAVMHPLPARHLASVKQWRYSWGDGIQVQYDASSVVVWKNFNPNSQVRGLPPVLAGVNEISSAYESFAYNRRFFSNNAEPSHIVNLPNVTDPKELEAFKEEYIANHSIRGGNSHRVMCVGGTDVEIKPVSTTVKEGSYLGLHSLTSELIMRLYKVPPVHGGLWDKANFDSVDAQNEVFAETVLMPSAEHMSQYLQLIVDRWYGSSNNVTGVKHVSRAVKKAFEKASAERPESQIIVILDIDHLPIISKLKAQKLGYAKDYQATFKVSPLEAAEEVGIEIEANDANQQVWVTTTETPYVAQPEPADETEPQDIPDDSEVPPEDEDLIAEKRQHARQISRSYRKLVLDKLDEGRVFRLEEADSLNTINDETLKRQFRLDYVKIKEMNVTGKITNAPINDTKVAAKEYLNRTYDRQFFKQVR